MPLSSQLFAFKISSSLSSPILSFVLLYYHHSHCDVVRLLLTNFKVQYAPASPFFLYVGVSFDVSHSLRIKD